MAQKQDRENLFGRMENWNNIAKVIVFQVYKPDHMQLFLKTCQINKVIFFCGLIKLTCVQATREARHSIFSMMVNAVLNQVKVYICSNLFMFFLSVIAH